MRIECHTACSYGKNDNAMNYSSVITLSSESSRDVHIDIKKCSEELVILSGCFPENLDSCVLKSVPLTKNF